MKTTNSSKATETETTFADVAWAINEAAKRPYRESKSERISNDARRARMADLGDPFAIFA